MAKTIGIVGSRRRDSQEDFIKIEKTFLETYEKGDIICSGLCSRGGDRFAVILAKKYSTETSWFPAEWDKYGRGAGFVRNTDIARTSDVLIACVASDRKGGTEDTVKKFIKFHGENNLILVE
jgi:hypothetical protein